MKAIVIIFCFWHIHVLCLSQSYTTINYTVSEGLPSNEVYEVFQDKQGFLWFATDNGVVKYDGYDMLRLGVEDGLTDPVVFGFHEDLKGRIWFRTFSGKLFYYDQGKVHSYKYSDKLKEFISKSIISSIYVDSLDQLWFSTYRQKGVYGKIDRDGNLEKQTPDSALLYYKDIGSNGQLFGYQQLDLKNALINDKLYKINPNDNCELFHVMPVKWKGKLYISVCNNILEFDGASLKIIHRTKKPIISLSKDQNDNLWVGYSGGGVDKFCTPDFVSSSTPQIFKKLSVTKVFQDNQKGFWISTLEQGVFHIPNISIKNHVVDVEKKIRFIASSKKAIYMANNDGEIFRASSKTKTELVHILKPPLKGLYVDKNEQLWASLPLKALCFNADFSKPAVAYSSSLTNATQDDDGNIYAVSGGAMIAIIKPNLKKVIEKLLPFMCRNVFLQDSILFIVTRNGLYKSDLSLSNPNEIPALSDFKINSILKLNDSTLLLTTMGRGFIVFNVKTYEYTNYNTSNSFVANNIFTALLQEEYLWLGTENGLIKLSRKSLFSGTLKFDILTKQNGLISTQINRLAYLDSLIWAFSDNGYSLINESVSHHEGHQPVFYLKNMMINNQQYSAEDKLMELPFDKNNIEVNFGFISLDKQKVFIRHRLNSNASWNNSTLKHLQYYSLAPGSYQIEAQYSLDNINWHSGFQSPKLIIEAPLWKRWYFLSSVAILLIVLIFLFFRNRMIVYRRHQRKLIQSEIQTLERERTRIAKDLHDSVGTDFSAIKMTVSQLLKKHNEPHADEIESHFQNTIQEIKNIIYGLSPPGLERYGLMTGLKNYAEKINGKVPVHIKVNTFGVEVKDPMLSISVFRIIQELVSNSLKHASAQNISIHINAFDDLLNVVYEDNGKGFVWNENSKGAGLYNIESRVLSINGKLKFESSEYGVSYTIDIPVKGNFTH